MTDRLLRRNFDSYRTWRWFTLPMLVAGPLMIWALGVMIHYSYATPHDVASSARKTLTQVATPYRSLSSYPDSLEVIGGLTTRGIAAAVANKQAMSSYQQPEGSPSTVFVASTAKTLRLTVQSYGYMVTMRLQPGRPAKLIGVPARINSGAKIMQVTMSVLLGGAVIVFLLYAEIRFQLARHRQRQQPLTV